MINIFKFYQISTVLVLISIVCSSHGKLPTTLLCADDDCKGNFYIFLSAYQLFTLKLNEFVKLSGIISMAKTTLGYNAPDQRMVSFQANRDARVIGKGKNGDHWKISIQGREGFAPKNFLREQKIYVSAANLVEVSLEVEVPTVDETVTEVPEVTDSPTVTSAESDTKSDSDTLTPSVSPSVSDDSGTSETQSVLTVDTETTQPTESDDTKASENQSIDSESVLEVTKTDAQTEQPKNTEQTTQVDEKVDVIKVSEVGQEVTSTEVIDDKNDGSVVSEDLDEEDVLEQEYASKKPVDEPLFIKKTVYKVGENAAEKFTDLDKEIKLEVVGIDNNVTEKIDTKTESQDRTIDASKTKADTNSKAPNDDENKSSENSDPEIKPTTPLPIEPDTKNISVENIEPSETVALTATELPETEQLKSIESVIEYDGTTINAMDIDDKIETTIETVQTPSSITDNVESTTLPSEIKPSVVDNTLISETKTADIENKTVIDTEPVPIVNQIDLSVADVVTPAPIIENTFAPTELPQTFETNPVTNDNTDPAEVVNSAQVENSAEAVNSAEINDNVAVPLNNYLNPSILSDRINEVPLIKVEQDQPQADFGSSEANEPEQITPRTTSEENQESNNSITPEQVTELKEEQKSDTGDIFSANYKPESSEEVIEENNGSWYDGILVTAEELFLTVQNLFISKSNDKVEIEVEEFKTLRSGKVKEVPADGFCEKLDGESCPKAIPKTSINCQNFECLSNLKNLEYDKYADEFLTKIVAMSDVVFLLAFTGFCVLLFTLGHYWLANNKREKTLLFRLNQAERNLLKTEKECLVIKAELIETRRKLTSIADKSFGADDMIKQCESEKAELREQIATLEKELETAAEAGLELNKMVHELLDQSGSDSIRKTVEELESELNNQKETTEYINNLLAVKCRENDELRVMLDESNGKFGTEIEELLKMNESLKTEKESLEIEMKETIHALEAELNHDLQTKSDELHHLSKQYDELKRKYEEITSRWQISAARAEALEDSIKKLKELSGKDIRSVIEITDANAKVLAAHKENESLKEQLDNENDNKQRLEEQIKIMNNEINRLRAEFNQNEKDKLEAQTRLDVLSSYFKEKEAQLQK